MTAPGADDRAGLRPFALDPAQTLYLWLAALYVTALLVANVVGVKLFRIPVDLGLAEPVDVEHTMGMLAFPLTFLLTDLVNEYYGRRATRRVVYLAFAMGAAAFAFIWISRRFPTLEGVPGTATAEAFENIFGGASLMYVASLLAFLAGALLDIVLFGLFKRWTGGRFVWFRATGSTVVSQLFDSFVVTFAFFQVFQRLGGGPAPSIAWTVKTALTGYVLKFVIALALTPAIYAGRWAVRRFLGLAPLPAGADL